MAAADRKITYTAAEVAELIRPLTHSVEALQKENAELKRKLEHMNEILANAQRARFGQSSEKKTYILSEDQMSLFNEAEICQDNKAEEPTEETLTVKAHARKKKRTIDELAKNLPVEEIVIGLPESRLTCDKCGGTFKLIGKKLVRREFIIIPQSEKILEYYSCTYACDKCEKDTGFAHIITTRTPPPLMKHSLASPSTVADVMTKKYVDGVPLARQEKIWARQGVELSRATMANWVIQCAQSWLKPLYKHMKRQLLEQSVIHADETVVQVLKEDNKPAASESRMWLYASGEYSSQHIRIFEYQPDRSGKRPESFLKGFNGCLITMATQRIQSGAEGDPLRLLGPCQAEMAGGHARRRNCENQQSRRRISVLHEAVLSGEEIHICRCQGSERVPPECGFAPSGGVFCMAEIDPPGKGQQTGGCGTVFPEPETAAHGISGLWRCPYLQ